MEREKLKEIIREIISERVSDLHKVDSDWTLETEGNKKVFLLYRGRTVATVFPEAMDRICKTWQKIGR